MLSLILEKYIIIVKFRTGFSLHVEVQDMLCTYLNFHQFTFTINYIEEEITSKDIFSVETERNFSTKNTEDNIGKCIFPSHTN